jgi:hypothetical protein
MGIQYVMLVNDNRYESFFNLLGQCEKMFQIHKIDWAGKPGVSQRHE